MPRPLFACLVLLLNGGRIEKKELIASLREQGDVADQLLKEIDARHQTASLVQEIGQATSNILDIDNLLKTVAGVMEKRLDFDRGMIMLANEDRTRLSYRAGFGHIDEHRFILERASFRLDNPDSRGVFVEAFKQQKPFLVDDFEAFERRHTTHSINVAKALGVKSFVCCPIVCEGEAVGVLAVDNLKTSRSLMQRDKSLLMGIAPVIGVAIRNAEHLLAKDSEFRSTLQVLAASIEVRDEDDVLLHTFDGSGGHTPQSTRVEAGLRIFKRIWGPDR